MPRVVEVGRPRRENTSTGNHIASPLSRGPSYWPHGRSISNKPDENSRFIDRRTLATPEQSTPLTPARESRIPSTPTSTRKVSASFSTDCPLSGHPTIAYSSVTASIAMNHPGPLTSHPVNRRAPLTSSFSHGSINPGVLGGGLKPSHTFSNLPLPATRYAVPPSKSSVGTTQTMTKPSSGRHAENIPPSTSMASLPPTKANSFKYPKPRPIPKQPSPDKKEKSRRGLSTSKTFNVFSNFTASLSRTSLAFTNESRRTSSSSKSTARKASTPYLNPQSASSVSSQALLNPTTETTNPHQIYTAQKSAYWTGRFMALQDRFQSEVLMPVNSPTLIHAHPPLASSATMGCIPQAAGLDRKFSQPTTISVSPQKYQAQQRQQRKPSQAGFASKTVRATTATGSTRPSDDAAAALLLSEDDRTRRIFTHLDGLCATSEARMSLQQWQMAYEIRAGKRGSIPQSGTAQGKARELSWVGRLLMGGGNGNAKKSNYGS